MILPPDPALLHPRAPAGPVAPTPAAALPDWLRRAVPEEKTLAPQGLAEVALTAGAALGALDAVVRRDEKWAGAWRQRLALTAAAATALQMGRAEDEAALRDAVLLTKLGDDVGPAGRLLTAWRLLAARPAPELLTAANLATALQGFGYAGDDPAPGDLLDELSHLPAEGLVMLPAQALAAARRHGFGSAVGAFLADALLAQRLGWRHAVALSGALMPARRARREAGADTEGADARDLLAAQARAALRAIDLSATLARRAGGLLALAPKLRAKGAGRVVQRLLSDDAMVASDPVAGMSDRALRRLFDRLVQHGAVRELSGRPTFRIYGL